MIWTASFWKGLGERAVKTFAASLAGLLGTAGLGLIDIDWGSALSVAGLATLVTVLVAVANPDFVAGSTPSTDGWPAPTRIVTDTHYAPVPAPADPEQPSAGVPPPGA